MTPSRTILFAVAVAVAQIAFLGWMINGRASILRDGREVLLEVAPVDPRDLLRGDYVRLAYKAGEVPANLLQDAPSADENGRGGTVFVRLAKQANGYWLPVAARFDQPPTPDLPADQVDLRATTGYFTPGDPSFFVDYGIDRFYLPEGEGLEIEKNMNVRPFAIVAVVAEDGTAQIKGLMDGDILLYEEPWY